MKVTAIIAEYNPFHNGHKYQLQKARELTGADYVIVIMSGNFTQRGTPAILDKYQRAKMALLNGADLVLELPAMFACSSAEHFANGAISILDGLGVVDYLNFGSEVGEIERLQTIASILIEEPPIFKKTLKEKLASGMSFPLARNRALEASLENFVHYEEIIKSPNNILGIEYIKSLLRMNSTIKPTTIRRMGSAYHDYKLNIALSSAISIRQSILHMDSLDFIEEQVPENCYEILMKNYKKTFPIYLDDFSTLLKYQLVLEQKKGFDRFADISKDLSDKISKNIFSFQSFELFCDVLKSKDLTHARISRCLSHILLDITKSDLASYETYGQYARVLGFREDATPLLSEIKKNSRIPFITKMSDAKNQLDRSGLNQFEKDVEISHIFETVLSSKFNIPIKNEYQRQIIKI